MPYLPSSSLVPLLGINLMQLYLPLCHTWVIYNNSGDEPHLVAERPFNQQVIIYDSSIWQQITEVAHD
ncbi:hypothetical protein myaer102_34370 [Microcystis viridis NIES-102]|uniref:Uncharacterized protein n=2 Tax=Microcystis viridis TaxID=44822 RepID=A0A3G9JLR4_MICVR|nr:hypothetical protein myaer102_34370 [Microcystis viridis NIES-102]